MNKKYLGTAAVAFVVFVTLFVLTACGQTSSSTSGGTRGEVMDNTKTYIVNGKPLECIIVHEGFAEQRTMGLSCDWVGYHAQDVPMQ